MFDLDKWQEILSSMRKNLFRTILTALGIFWAMFMFVLMLGGGAGLENGITKGFEGYATNSCYIWARRTTIPYKGFERGRRFRLTNLDTEYLKNNIEGVELVCPRNQLGGYRDGNNITYLTKAGNFTVMGDVPDIAKVRPREMTAGRFLNDFDMSDFRKVCSIGIKVKEVLFGDDIDPIGKYLKINGVYFKVIGVFKKISNSDNGSEDEETVHIPNTTFQRAFNYGNAVSWFAITAKDDIPVSEIEQTILSRLGERHSVSPDDERAFGHYNAEEEMDRMMGLINAINFIVFFVGSGTLLAGVIGISNIMLIVVKERTKEIGIKRALGARPIAIINQIISESIILTLIAGYVGLFISVGILEGLTYFLKQLDDDEIMFQNPAIDYQTAIISLVLLIFAGVLAGLIPANRALSIKPVEALRDE